MFRCLSSTCCEGELEQSCAREATALNSMDEHSSHFDLSGNKAERWHHFEVELDRGTGKRLGLAVKQDKHRNLLKIMSVDGDDTSTADWNREHPESPLKQGDFISSVNSVTDVGGIMLECKKPQMLRLRVQRSVK